MTHIPIPNRPNKQVPNEINKTAQIEKIVKDSNTLVAFATVETEDAAGDIVRVDGMSLQRHTEKSPLKILASHMHSSSTGEPTVIGKVTKIFKTKKGGSKAVKFAMEFADTPLAQQWKSLFDGGFVDSFSIGASVKKTELLKDKEGNVTGFDFQETELVEISAVAVPANPMANVAKTAELLKKVHELEKDHMEKETNKETADVEVEVSTEASDENPLAELAKRFDVIEERLDEIASTLVSEPQILPRATDGNQADEALKGALDELLNTLRNKK